jgi:hypothetical protein
VAVFSSFLWWLLSWLRRVSGLGPAAEIAYFSYALAGGAGESTSQEDVFAVDPGTGQDRRLTDDRTNPVFVSDRTPPGRRTAGRWRSTGLPTPNR